MSSSASVRMHNIISIKPRVREFDDFTVYSWFITDRHGVTIECEFFHSHGDALMVHPKVIEDCRPKE